MLLLLLLWPAAQAAAQARIAELEQATSDLEGRYSSVQVRGGQHALPGWMRWMDCCALLCWHAVYCLTVPV